MQKIKSSISFTLIILLLLCASPLTAYADVVWGNNFSEDNKEETEPLGRRFYVDSPNGYVTTQAAPGSHNDDYPKITIIDGQEFISIDDSPNPRTYYNGQVLPIYETYNDNGRYWGLIFSGGHGGPEGWIPMDELLLIYTIEDFMRENEDEFYIYTGSLSSLSQMRSIVFWAWPGSDRERIVAELSRNPQKREEGKSRIVLESEEDILAYEDDGGRVWLYIEVEYYYKSWRSDIILSHRYFEWVCLTEPGNPGIPAFNPAPDPVKWVPGENQSWVHPEFDDSFYTRFSAQILNLGRTFIASGENNYVSVMDAPDLENEIARLENGESVFMEYSCLYKGKYWGYMAIPGSSTDEYGWVMLDELLVLYDYVSFREDNIDDIFSGFFNVQNIRDAEAVIAWEWPGSGVPLWTVEGLDIGMFNFAYYYWDEGGRAWGFIRYLHGGGNIWVCISDPINPDIPAFNPAPPPAKWISDTEHTDIARFSGLGINSGITFIIALVVVLVLSSILLILVFWKQEKWIFSKRKQ